MRSDRQDPRTRATLFGAMRRLALLSLLLPGAEAYACSRAGRSAEVCRAMRHARPAMAAAEFLFEMNEDRSKIRFGCRQRSLTPVKPEEGGSLQEFISSNSDAIVMSSWDAGQVQRVEGQDNEFLIAVEEFDFVALRFAVELRARCTLDEQTCTARLDSLGFRMIGPGMERVGDAIDVTVTGALRPSAPDARLCALSGDVSFVASGDIPGVLRAAPEAALRAAARAMSESLISAAQERFNKRVPMAYARWAQSRVPASK